MGEKTFGNGSRIIATHPSDIDGDSADNRPIGGSVVVLKRSSIFAKNYIFNPMQTILNPPMRANRLGKFKCRGRERANVIVSLVVRFSLTDTNALDTDQMSAVPPNLASMPLRSVKSLTIRQVIRPRMFSTSVKR